MLKTIAILLAGAIVSAGVHATEDKAKGFEELLTRSEIVTAMYLTCIKHTVEANDLEDFINAKPGTFVALDENNAKEFLHGFSGKAWGFRMHQSGYVVTQTTGGICAVNAKKADRSTAVSDLKTLLDFLYNGNEVPLKASERTASAHATQLIGWYIHHERVKKNYSFTVVVGNGNNPPAEVVYSVLVSKAAAPNNSFEADDYGAAQLKR